VSRGKNPYAKRVESGYTIRQRNTGQMVRRPFVGRPGRPNGTKDHGGVLGLSAVCWAWRIGGPRHLAVSATRLVTPGGFPYPILWSERDDLEARREITTPAVLSTPQERSQPTVREPLCGSWHASESLEARLEGVGARRQLSEWLKAAESLVAQRVAGGHRERASRGTIGWRGANDP
jgi:hypothetical protein